MIVFGGKNRSSFHLCVLSADGHLISLWSDEERLGEKENESERGRERKRERERDEAEVPMTRREMP